MLINVSNRLPVTAGIKDDQLVFSRSIGGVATGLSSYLEKMRENSEGAEDYLWVGWPGISAKDSQKAEMTQKLRDEFRAHPVFFAQTQMDRFYNGFCNKTLWPLFHYFTTTAVYSELFWNQYKAVNQIFCDALLEILKPGDILWVHDYHLMLLPKMIREKMPDISIGFFLHIPFPSYEVFRLLPSQWGREILEGLLGSNLIGFHTHDYSQYFRRCVLRILGYENKMGSIDTKDNVVHVDTFPMGIDFEKFHDAAKSQKVADEKKKLVKPDDDVKIIASVDRLDYTKGVLNRLEGYAKFLELYPEWHKRVILFLVVSPSRVEVDQYARMKRQIDELVGNINGKYGTLDWTPTVYQNRSLSFDALVALYSVSDVGLITPLRDGMNLIAKEYIASRTDKTGVLVLSDMAGAAKEMGESIVVNPNSREEIAIALKEALEMPKDDQVKRNTMMQDRLSRYNVFRWADDFMKQLKSMEYEQHKTNARLLNPSIQVRLTNSYKDAKKRLLLLDYDGTLVPFQDHPSKANPNDEVLNTLTKLTKDDSNDVIIISGRDHETLEEWLGHLPVQMVAEHGVFVRDKKKKWKYSKEFNDEWKAEVKPILLRYSDRTPGSFVEEKGATLVWHYRKVDPELGSVRAKEVIDDLLLFTGNIDVQVLQGHKVVEIRNTGVDKGSAARRFLVDNGYDFILAIGDDVTDEDLFKALPASAYTIKVGMTSSYAWLNLKGQTEVMPLLDTLSFAGS